MCGETTPSWETQLEYDVNYAINISFWLDVKIICMTLIILFKRIKNSYGSEDRPHLNVYRARALEEETNELSVK